MNRKNIKVVFDVDDVLWGLNEKSCSVTGINPDDIVTFRIMENPILNMEQKKRIYESYGNPDVFKNIQWYSGVEKINLLADYGIDVYINSNSLTEEIRNLKYKQLREILNIPEERITLNIIGVGCYKPKPITEEIAIFVDDSPHNIAGSFAQLNLMPTKPWNKRKESMEEATGKNIIKMECLDEIMEYIISRGTKELSA